MLVYRLCSHCGVRYASRGNRSASGGYCSTRCRVAAHRASKQQTEEPYIIQYPFPYNAQYATPEIVTPDLVAIADERFSPEFKRVPVTLTFEDGHTTKTSITRSNLNSLVGTEFQTGDTTRTIKEVTIE